MVAVILPGWIKIISEEHILTLEFKIVIPKPGKLIPESKLSPTVCFLALEGGGIMKTVV